MLTLERRLPRNRLLDDITLHAARASAIVRPDQRHPFFYDHPLDHVPGLLLIEAAFQIGHVWAHRQSPQAAGLTGFSVRFRRFCLHGAPLRLGLTADPAGSVGATLSVAVRQDGGGAADVTLRLAERPDRQTESPPIAADLAALLLPWEDVPQNRVKKHNRDNVMIAHPSAIPGGLAARMLPPSPRNDLGDGHPRFHHPLYLLEAFMQLLRFQNTAEAETGDGDAPRMRDILAGIDVEILAPVARGVPVFVVSASPPRVAARCLIRDARLDTAEGAAMRVSVLTSRLSAAAPHPAADATSPALPPDRPAPGQAVTAL